MGLNILDSASLRNCTSCQVCATVCSQNAITIKLDKNGFYRPIVDSGQCNQCGVCTNVCYKFDKSIEQTSEGQFCDKPLYSAWAKDDSLIKVTTSGGIGDLLAHELLKEGYKVVGVAYNEDETRAEHQIASAEEELIPFRGSKYIQSYTFDAFKEIVSNCKNERYAVFGTPCQIYALNKLAALRRKRENFVFADLYCHGCPSLHIWTKYQQSIKKSADVEKFDKVVFRSKIKGWGAFYIVVIIVDGKPVYVSSPRNDNFYELFFSDLVLNDACNNCRLRSTLEYTDIRLGDFWGKKFLDNHKGVSAVSISSDIGKSIFEKIQDKIVFKECDYSDFLPYQSWGIEYKPKMETRMAILESLSDPNSGIDEAIAIYRKDLGLKGTIKRHIKGILSYFPVNVTNNLKKIIYSL